MALPRSVLVVRATDVLLDATGCLAFPQNVRRPVLKQLIRQLLARSFRAPASAAHDADSSPARAIHAAIAHHSHGHYAEAESAYRAVLERNPHDADALHFLGNLCIAQRRLDEGLSLLERAAALRPESATIAWHRGSALHARGRHREAAAVMLEVRALDAGFFEILTAIKDALLAEDRLDEAEACCRRLVELIGGAAQAKARSDLGTVLLRLGRLTEALGCYSAALDLDPAASRIHSNLLYAMHYDPTRSPEGILAEHRRWAEVHAGGPTRRWRVAGRAAGASPVLRVGYVSPDFCHHPVSDYIEPVIRNHDRSAFEIHCYSDVVRRDQFTQRLQALDVRWRDTASLTDEQLAAQVYEDRIDILVDLAGHTRGNRLLMFARRAAPVQVSWIGYPGTTGLAEMDYRVTDALADPPGTTDHLYTEVLVRLPQILVVFAPPAEAPEVNALPAAARGSITFGSFNGLQKITDDVVALWARILVRQPGTRLIMLSVPEGAARSRLHQAFAANGVGPGRVELRGRATFREFLGAHHEVDIALDPFPYAGGSTTFLTLWMGVPVITLAGRWLVSRAGVTILSNAGLARLVAHDPEEYVAKAVALAEDLEDLARLRSRLRAGVLASPLTDAVGLTRALEFEYRNMWANYGARRLERAGQ